MKKLIALLLAAAMLLSMTACGGSAEPVETAPVTTEAPTTAPTEAPTEEPTEAPTEAPRLSPPDFEAVDPETQPDPPPVEEQLQAENTQTVVLNSIEEYEDLLWNLGFQEVRLAGSHEAYKLNAAEAEEFYSTMTKVNAYCEPVSLTYNEAAFRFDFTYCMTAEDGTTVKETGWSMYGTKSNTMDDVSKMTDAQYQKKQAADDSVLGSDDVFVITSTDAEVEALLAALQTEGFAGITESATKSEKTKKTENYEEDLMEFYSNANPGKSYHVKTVYYPGTGNLYNYMRDPNSEGTTASHVAMGPDGSYQGIEENVDIGYASQSMCFHYLFPTEAE